MDFSQGNQVCILCGNCIPAGLDAGAYYAQWPRGEMEINGEYRSVGYRPRYYLRERLHNASGFAGAMLKGIRQIVHEQYLRLVSQFPEMPAWIHNPIYGKYVFVEILRYLARQTCFDAPTTHAFRTPTLKERWTFFWQLESGFSCPADDVDDFEATCRALHGSFIHAFPLLKTDVWAKRKNLPFLPYILGIALLRRYGKAFFLSIAAWWLPPKTPQTLKKCRLFVKKLTDVGYLDKPGVDTEDIPPEVFRDMQTGKNIADRVRAYLQSTGGV